MMPFLLTLLLNNQNNNQGNNQQPPAPNNTDPIADSVAPQVSALELTPRAKRETLPTQEEELRDGPLTLLLCNLNNNNQGTADPIADSVAPQVSGLELVPRFNEENTSKPGEELKDGPLTLASLLTNQNNSQQAATLTNTDLVADSMAPQVSALKMTAQPEESDLERVEESAAGPLLLTLRLINMNQNNEQAASLTTTDPVADSVAPQVSALEIAATDPSVLKLRGEEPCIRTGRLDAAQICKWNQNGYLVIPDAIEQDIVSNLRETVKSTAEDFFRSRNPDVKVHTHDFRNQQQQYVNPCGRVIASLEDNALTDTSLTPLQRIRRIGCGCHRHLRPFRAVTFSPFHAAIARSLDIKDPRVVQSIIITKAAGIGPKVVPHQDGCSSFTDPASSVTFWYALEDTTIENGCLAVAPGSHRVEPLRKRCKSNSTGRPEFEKLESPVFGRLTEELEGAPLPEDATILEEIENGGYEYTKLEVKAGTLILMHSNLMHTSEANKSLKSRIAFNFTVVDGTLEWRDDNYLQPYEGETEFERLVPLVC